MGVQLAVEVIGVNLPLSLSRERTQVKVVQY